MLFFLSSNGYFIDNVTKSYDKHLGVDVGHRLSKIYTRTGDTGTTGLGDGSRVAKDDIRIETLGDIDELNAIIGVLRCHIDDEQWQQRLSLIQHWLFDLGGEVCIPNYTVLKAESVAFLEQDIDAMNQHLPMLKEFILPAGSLACATAHHARAVCRRAERRLMSLHQRDNNVQTVALQFINRLSDWLFVASRELQRTSGQAEVLWQKNIVIPQ